MLFSTQSVPSGYFKMNLLKIPWNFKMDCLFDKFAQYLHCALFFRLNACSKNQILKIVDVCRISYLELLLAPSNDLEPVPQYQRGLFWGCDDFEMKCGLSAGYSKLIDLLSFSRGMLNVTLLSRSTDETRLEFPLCRHCSSIDPWNTQLRTYLVQSLDGKYAILYNSVAWNFQHIFYKGFMCST